jgi:hypothetical protein
VPNENPAKELEKSDAVFSGKVTDIKSHEQAKNVFERVEAVIQVDSAWKGIEEKTVSVFTAAHSATCGYGFRQGEAYLVYAGRSPQGRLSTTICSRTRRLKDAGDDLRELGPGKKVGTTNSVRSSMFIEGTTADIPRPSGVLRVCLPLPVDLTDIAPLRGAPPAHLLL